MAKMWNKEWSREDLVKRVGDMDQLVYARSSVLDEGKARGVRMLNVSNGPLSFNVLPGRGMDIADISYNGFPFAFLSGAGITSPAYYEEPGDGWVRSFYGGLLETCGITYSGAASEDEGKTFGLHGRIGNVEAEDVSIRKRWMDNDYILEMKGVMKESSPFRELNMRLHRTISTAAGSNSLCIEDTVSNLGFTAQPLMMIYHFNFGFPALSENAEVIGPIVQTEGRDDAARQDDGEAHCLVMEKPERISPSRVFFHTFKGDSEGNTFIALVNKERGDGNPFAVIMRFNQKQLPAFTECKIMKDGFYFLALEPGLVVPLGRKVLREQGKLFFLDGQKEYDIKIEIQATDSKSDIEQLYRERDRLLQG